MADDFQIGDGTVAVRGTDGKLIPILTPAGYTDLVFRSIVAATDTAYRIEGREPTLEQIQSYYPRASRETIAALTTTEQFRQALSVRGIRWGDDSGLSMEQHSALLKLSDTGDVRTTKARLADLGIPLAKHQGWMRTNPLYGAAYRKMSEDGMQEIIATALIRLQTNVETGDQRAIEKALEMTGRYDTANKQIEDVRNLVTRLVEAVIRNVKDEPTRRAIMSDMRAVSTSFELLSPRQSEE